MTSKDPATPPPFTAEDFPADPGLECDVVMKGGITSGVIYPLAVCELATTYRLRSVGGASAGAIAAAVAAAAELGRRTGSAAETVGVGTGGEQLPAAMVKPVPTTGSGDENAQVVLPAGYLGLSRFPELLTQPQADGQSLLFHLFRPQQLARRLFGLATGAIAKVSRLPKGQRLGWFMTVATVAGLAVGLAKSTPVRTLVGALLGLVATAWCVAGLVALPADPSPVTVVALVLGLVVGLLVMVIGALVGSVTGVVSDLRALPRIGFGMSAGRGETDQELALTPWLERRLQELAGRPYDQPLLMGDLWAQDIQLQAMTTNLSRLQPMVMPWDDHTYFFEPDEFEKLFGAAVRDAMCSPDAAPGRPADPDQARRWDLLLASAGSKRPFPRAERLPVIVATRMSLSFPLLISAVRLYAVDWDLPTNQAVETAARSGSPRGDLEWDTNWFSDGGLTSNLPVQFFDSQLPSRPTFAIDLEPFGNRRRSSDEQQNSALPGNDQVTQAPTRPTVRWTSKNPIGQLVEFGTSLVNTARTWVDEASLVMPGYRDRVVTVFQEDKTEGGLNLSMDKAIVDGLSLRGRFAAQRLVQRFGPGGGWPNHRWIRFRTATAALSDWLAGFERGYTVDPEFYASMLSGSVAQPSYPIEGERLAAVRRRIAGLRTEIEDWAGPPTDAFTANRPLQPPVLRLVPPTNEAEPSSVSPGAGGAS